MIKPQEYRNVRTKNYTSKDGVKRLMKDKTLLAVSLDFQAFRFLSALSGLGGWGGGGVGRGLHSTPTPRIDSSLVGR